MARAPALRRAIDDLIPRLTHLSHKGQHGRVGVLGGCLEYCGAPYYAALSALKCGADISHIFCTEEAGVPIKSFSPELIVHPLLRTASSGADTSVLGGVVSQVSAWIPRLHSLVVGPGLGRDSLVLEAASSIVGAAQARGIPIVLDADGLFLLTQHTDLFGASGYANAILTPNVVEFARLCKAFGVDTPTDRSATAKNKALKALAAKLGHPAILLKGEIDLITCGSGDPIGTGESDCTRRCGGQGDIVAGTAGVFAAWAHVRASAVMPAPSGAGTGAGAGAGEGSVAEVADAATAPPSMVLAAAGASLLTRRAASIAFRRHRRGTTTPDIITSLGEAFEEVFPEATPKAGAESGAVAAQAAAEGVSML